MAGAAARSGRAAAIAYAGRFPAWGHRKLAELLRVDDHHTPDSTVLRALRRTGRVQPVDYQAERRLRHGHSRRDAGGRGRGHARAPAYLERHTGARKPSELAAPG